MVPWKIASYVHLSLKCWWTGQPARGKPVLVNCTGSCIVWKCRVLNEPYLYSFSIAMHPMKTSLIYPWIHPSPRKQRSDAMARSAAPPRPYWMPCGRPCPEQVVPPCSTAWPGSWRDLDESLWINSQRGLESMGIRIQHMEVLPFCHAKCGFKGILMRYLGKL